MQPALPYQPERYPPRGRIWPQFGDEVLEHTLSLGEGIRQSLQKKKEGMSQWHQENLAHHGLAPKSADIPVPDDDPGYPPDAPRPPADLRPPAGPLPYTEPPPDPPREPKMQFGRTICQGLSRKCPTSALLAYLQVQVDLRAGTHNPL